MTELKCKTRGNTSPQGKPRVYFCCHPKDHGTYFEEIAEDILSKQNCAIWYAEGGNAEYTEEYLERLREMQLFVMPVTYDLLCTENDALNRGFRFAIDNKIPVLPLIQDVGLVEKFNKKCGDLQYLDKNANDDTAISYGEKLEKYLSSVLIGDELAEKIRSSFDAYVFLSYRKKDRKYAQELMRLIHRNEFCRDIAIWYDEYLTPGENFNDSIKSALEKSGLFVLAVTPNLVNEQNYIMTTEYPMAKQAGKPILPAELVPTDKQLLAEKYADIPNCTDARNAAALSRALTDALGNIVIKGNDGSPIHNFFIGLAYLGGIDVEVNFDRALELISFAAESGLVEAMEKLADMYQNGMGVARDYDKMILWTKQKSNVIEAKYNRERTPEALVEYIKVTCDLVGQLVQIGRGAEGIEIVGFALNKAENSGYVGKDMEVDINVGQLYLMLSKIYINDRKVSNAREVAIKANELLAGSYSECSDLRVLKKLVQIGSMLSVVEMSIGSIPNAIKYGYEAVKRCEMLCKTENSFENSFLLGGAYISLCGTFVHANDLEKAREYCQKALSTGEPLMQENSEQKTMHLVATAYKFMGMLEEKLSNFDVAEDNLKKEINIRRDIYEKYPTAQNLSFLEKCYGGIGRVLLKAKKSEETERYYTMSVQISEKLWNDYQTVQYLLGYADAISRVSVLKRDRKDYVGAEEGLHRAIEIIEKARSIEGKGLYDKEIAIAYTRMGGIKRLLKKNEEGKTYYTKAAEIYEKLYKESGSKFMQVCLGGAYCGIARILAAEGDAVGGSSNYKKQVEMGDNDPELFNYSGYLTDYLMACKYVGTEEEKVGDVGAACDYYEKYANALKYCPNYKMTDYEKFEYATVLFKMGKYGLGDKTECFSRARDLYKELSLRYPNSEKYKKNYEIMEKWIESARQSDFSNDKK